MNNVLLGLLLGAILGALDGMTAWFIGNSKSRRLPRAMSHSVTVRPKQRPAKPPNLIYSFPNAAAWMQ